MRPHLHSQRQHVTVNFLGECRLLLGRPALEEFLDDIVAEYVRHQLEGAGQDLVEHKLPRRVRGGGELLLDEPRAVLVAGKLNDVPREGGQLQARVPAVAEVFEQLGAHHITPTATPGGNAAAPATAGALAVAWAAVAATAAWLMK